MHTIYFTLHFYICITFTEAATQKKKYIRQVESTCINQPIESAYCNAAMSKKSITERFGKTRFQQRERERIETCAPVFKELTDMFTDMQRGKPAGPRGGRLGKRFNNGHPIKLGTSAKISNGVAPLIWFKRWVFCRKIHRCRYRDNQLLRGVDYRSRQNWKQHVFYSGYPMCSRWRPNYPMYFSVGAGDKCKNRSENCYNGRDV